MYDWLREEVAAWYATGEPEEDYCGIPYAFINWLAETGASPWRSVERDGLPPMHDIGCGAVESMNLFARGKYGRAYESRCWRNRDGKVSWDVPFDVDYWMPVPPLPKEEP